MATAAERAFQRKVNGILRSIDNLAEDAVRNALKLLGEMQQRILGRLVGMPADAFLARHLSGLRFEVEQAVRELVARYQDEVESLIEDAAALGVSMVDEPYAAAGLSLEMPPIPRRLIEVLQGYSADLISRLGDEARRRINGVISDAAIGALSVHDAIQAIAGNLPDRSVFRSIEARAEAIFRTEVNRVFEVANQARLEQMAAELPGVQKKWVTAADVRVRPSHASAGGQVVGAEAMFAVGGYECSYPRDPVLPASESVNCRCHSVPVMPTVDEAFGPDPSAPALPAGEQPGYSPSPFDETLTEAGAHADVTAVNDDLATLLGRPTDWDGTLIRGTSWPGAHAEKAYSCTIKFADHLFGDAASLGLSQETFAALRWHAAVHESLHAFSKWWPQALVNHRALEEGTVEALTRAIRRSVLQRIGVTDLASIDFATLDAMHLQYGQLAKTIDKIRIALGAPRRVPFYNELLQVPLDQRRVWLLQKAAAISPEAVARVLALLASL